MVLTSFDQVNLFSNLCHLMGVMLMTIWQCGKNLRSMGESCQCNFVKPQKWAELVLAYFDQANLFSLMHHLAQMNIQTILAGVPSLSSLRHVQQCKVAQTTKWTEMTSQNFLGIYGEYFLCKYFKSLKYPERVIEGFD